MDRRDLLFLVLVSFSEVVCMTTTCPDEELQRDGACGNDDRQNSCRLARLGTGPWKRAAREAFNKLINLHQAHALRRLVTWLPGPFLVLHIA